MRENVQIWSKKWFHETDDVHTKRNKKTKLAKIWHSLCQKVRGLKKYTTKVLAVVTYIIYVRNRKIILFEIFVIQNILSANWN